MVRKPSAMVVILLQVLVHGLCLTLAAHAHAANSQTLFEGLYRVTLRGQHVGYAIQRYDYDPKKKQFVSTMFVHTSLAAGNSVESLKAYASQSLAPISYQYTAKSGDKITTIDATFKLQNAQIVALKDGKRQTVNKTIPPNVFLSTFLYYRIMNSPKGLRVGSKYEFNALAEEEATIYSGESWVQKLTTWQGNSQAYQVLNQFKNSKYITTLNAKGEILGTHSPLEGVRTELVATLQEAAGPFSVNQKTLQILFGEIPSGLNDLTRKPTPPTSEMAKQGPGLPQGRVFIKAGAEKSTDATDAKESGQDAKPAAESTEKSSPSAPASDSP